MSIELTGGAGFAYEDGVAALYLATILTEGAPPGLPDARCELLSFQRGENNHPLDDLVVEARRQDGETVRLDLQITTNIALTAGNVKFADIVRRAWHTIESKGFTLARDRVGAAVGTVSATAARDMGFVCEAARDSVDTGDFGTRLKTWSARRQQLVETVRSHMGEAANLSNAWLLLRHFVLLQFSVAGDGARDAQNAIELLRHRTPDADALWHRLMTIAQSAKTTGGSLDSTRIEERLRGAITLHVSRTAKDEIARLEQYGRSARESIHREIDGYHLRRPAVLDDILAAMEGTRLVNVHGRPGSGKSVQLRDLADLLDGQGRPVLFLKADRLAEAGWVGLRNLLGLTSSSAVDVFGSLSLSGDAVVLIDGVDRVQPVHRALVIDVVEALVGGAAGESWSMVTTVRTGSLQDLANWFPLHRFQTRKDVEVKPLDDLEAETLANAQPRLRDFLFGAPALREIARRPFFLARLARLPSSPAGQVTTEVDLAAQWWRYGGHDAEGEPMRRRRAALLAMARSGARTLGRGVSASSVDANALDGLIQDEVVVERDRGLRVSFAHDIFFEWAFLHVLLEAEDKLAPLRTAGEPPALGRPIELLSQDMLAHEPDQWRSILVQFEQQEVRSQWSRCWLLGPFQARLRTEDATRLREVALNDEARRLERILTWSRATRTQANPVVLSQPTATEDEAYRNAEIADIVPWPEDFPSWRQLCEWLCSMADRIPPRLWLDVILVFEVWQTVARDFENSVSTNLADVVRRWLEALENHYHPEERSGFPGKFPGLDWKDDDTLVPRARQLLLGNVVGNPQVVEAYLKRLEPRASLHDSAMSDVILCSPRLSTALPGAFVDFLLKALLEPLPNEELEQRRKRYEAELRAARDGGHRLSPFLTTGFSSTDDLRLDELSIGEGRQQFYPAHPRREPFKSLFEHAPDEAIRFVRCVANHAIDAWRELHEIQNERRGTPIPIDLSFPWGEMRFWGGAREYGMFRGTFSPHALTSGLMAMEAWGFDQIDAGTTVDDLLARVIPGQRNIALLGIAESWMLYKSTASLACLPIATNPRVWKADIQRLVQIDMTSLYSNEIGIFDQVAEVVEALGAHNRRPHRRLDVRSLAPLYLFSGEESLKTTYVAALSRFPDQLPFEIEEERSSSSHVQELKQVAEAQASMAKSDEYRIEPVPSQEGKVAIHPPAVDSPQARAAAERVEQMNLVSGAYMLVTDVLETGEVKEGRPTRADALLTARTLWRERKGSKGHVEMQDGTSVGMAAVVLKERDKFEDDDIGWAFEVVEATLKEPWPDDDMLPGTILPWHPLRMASAALASTALLSEPEAQWARRELLRLLTHPLDAVSHPALKAAFEVGDRDPRFCMIALRLGLDLHIRDDPLWPRMEREERAAFRRQRVDNALKQAYDLLDNPSAKVEPPTFPQAWKKISVDKDGREVVRFMEPERWLEVRELHADIKAIDIAVWLADQRKEFLLQVAERLTQWAVERCEPDRRRGGSDHMERSQSDLELLWGLAGWLGILTSHLPHTIARQSFVDLLITAPGEAGLDIVARFADMLVCSGVYDAPNIAEGVLEILSSCADRLPPPRRWSDRDYLPDGTDRMCRALLFMSVENAGGATRFANGDYGDVASILPIVDQVLQRVGPHPRITSYWLTLVERARRYYDADAFMCQVEQLIVAKHPLAWRATRIPSRLANLIRYFAEEERFGKDRMRAVLTVLDALIDEGDRRAAAIQQSEVFRMIDRTTAEARR